jgi:hypothetical protein
LLGRIDATKAELLLTTKQAHSTGQDVKSAQTELTQTREKLQFEIAVLNGLLDKEKADSLSMRSMLETTKKEKEALVLQKEASKKELGIFFLLMICTTYNFLIKPILRSIYVHVNESYTLMRLMLFLIFIPWYKTH